MGDFDFLYTPRPLPMLVQDPYDREREKLSLAALARARDLGDIEIETKKRGVKDDEVIRRLWPDLVRGGFTDETIKTVLPQAGDATPALMKLVGEQRKSMLDADKTKAETRDKEISAKNKAFGDISAVSYAEFHRKGGPDHLSAQRIRDVAKTYGYELPDMPGDPRDPMALNRWIEATGNMAYKAHEQAANELTRLRDFNTDERGRLTITETERKNREDSKYKWATLAETKAQHGEANKIARDAAGVGTWAVEGYDPVTKQPIWRNTKTPMLVNATNADGKVSLAPYGGGAPMSSTDMSKLAVKRLESGEHLRRIEQLEADVEKYPRAFNTGTALAESFIPPVIPGGTMAKNYLAKKQMTEEERLVRTRVMREAAQVVNDIYGAALSRQEGGKAATWAPEKEDDFDTTMIKLKGAKAYAAEIAGEGGGGSAIPGRILKRPGG